MADLRIVAFDLMSQDPDYYFVLTEALQEFAARQRSEAGDLDEHDAAQRIRWAETAESALERIEKALSMPARASGPAPVIGYLAGGKAWHPSDVTIVRQGAAQAAEADHG
jgi:hypothetical protein